MGDGAITLKAQYSFGIPGGRIEPVADTYIYRSPHRVKNEPALANVDVWPIFPGGRNSKFG